MTNLDDIEDPEEQKRRKSVSGRGLVIIIRRGKRVDRRPRVSTGGSPLLSSVFSSRGFQDQTATRRKRSSRMTRCRPGNIQDATSSTIHCFLLISLSFFLSSSLPSPPSPASEHRSRLFFFCVASSL